MILNMKNKIDLGSGTAYLLKFAFVLFITIATIGIMFVLGIIMSVILGNSSILIPNLPEVFALSTIVFGMIVLSNSVWDILAISSAINIPIHAALRYDWIRNMVLTKFLVLLIAIAGIGYIPMAYYFFPDYTCLGAIVWIIHAGAVLLLTRYTEILSIRLRDPFTIIFESIRIIKNNFLESLVITLFEIAFVFGMVALIMQILNLYSAVVITFLIYLSFLKPAALKTSIQITTNTR